MIEHDRQDVSLVETPFEMIDGELDDTFLYEPGGRKVTPQFIGASNVDSQEVNKLERLRSCILGEYLMFLLVVYLN